MIKNLLLAEEREVVGMLLSEWNEQEHEKAAKQYAEQCREEGEFKEKQEVITSMFALGIDLDKISASVKWPVEKVKEYLNK